MMMMIKFLLLALLVISPMSIYADKDLMIKECHNAQVPTICMQCLESDPSSVRADRVGIASIIIHCLDSSLNIISNNITNLSSEKQGEVKTTLETCKKDLSTKATTKLSEAETSLKAGDYNKAAKSVKLALDYAMTCKDNLKRVEFTTSPEVFSQINIYVQLSEAAMRIIDRF